MATEIAGLLITADAQTGDAERGLDRLNDKHEKTVAGLKSGQGHVSSYTRVLQQFAAANTQAVTAVGSLTGANQKNTSATTQGTSATNQSTQATNANRTAHTQAAGAVQHHKAAIDNLRGSLQSVAGDIRNVGMGLTASITLPMLGAAAAATKFAGDLQSKVSLIRTIRPDFDTSGVFKSLSSLQTKIPQTSDQLGEAAYNIVSSLDDIGEAATLNLTEKFGKGATAARVEALDFGTAILGVMNAYKLNVGDADKISDLFFQTVNRGIITGAELSHELAGVSKAAQNAGVDFDTMFALIVGATKEAGPAAENMTQLSQVLNQFTGKEAQKGLKELGIVTHDAQGQFLPFISILEQVKARYDKLSEVDQSKLVQGLFPDIRSQKGFATLLRQLPSVQAAKDDPNKTGSADRAFETVSKDFNFQFGIFKNTVRHAFETVGAELLPVLIPLVKMLGTFLVSAIQTAVDAWKNLPSGAKAGIVALLGMAAALGPLLTVIGTVAAAVLGLAGTIGSLITATAAVGGIAALSEILIPVGLVIAGITIVIVEWAAVATAAVIAVRAAWQTNWLGIRDLTFSAWNAIKSFLLALWSELQQAYALIWPQIKTLTQNVLAAIQLFWNAHGKQIVLVIQTAWAVITTTIRAAVRIISSLIAGVLALINGDWQTVWDMAVRIVEGFVTALGTIFAKVTAAMIALMFSLMAQAEKFFLIGQTLGLKLVIALADEIRNGGPRMAAALVALAVVASSPGILAAYAAAGVAQARARNEAFEANLRVQESNKNPQRYDDEGEYVSGAPGYSSGAASVKSTPTDTTKGTLPKGFGDGKKSGSGENAAVKKFKLEMQLAEVQVQAIERLNQKLLTNAEFSYSQGISQLDQYVAAREKAVNDLFAAENQRNNQEVFALQASGLRGKQRELAEAQLTEKVKATWQKHEVALTEIQRYAESERLAMQRSAQQAAVSLAEESAAGTEALWRRLADQGVATFAEAQRQVAAAQFEILEMQEHALVKEQTRLNPGTAKFEEIAQQLQQIRQRMANFLSQSSADKEEALRRDADALSSYQSRIRGIYDSIADMEIDSARDRLRILEQMGVRKEVIWKREAQLALDVEKIESDRRIADLRRQLEYVKQFEKNETRRFELIQGINSQIEAEEKRSGQRRENIMADYYEKQRQKLREWADKVVDVFKTALDRRKEEGWKGFFKSLGDSFRDELERMALDLMRSRVLSLLQTVFKVPQAGGASGKTNDNQNGGIVNSLLRLFGFGGVRGADDQATKTATPIVTAVDRSTAQIVAAVHQAGMFNHANSANRSTQGLAANLLGGFTSNTPFAITQAGHEAVHAIDAAGAANSGAVDRTGKSTSSAIITAGQGMVSVMTQMLSIMANFGTSGGFTWKGLFASMAIGAVNGAVNGLFSGGSGSQGGVGSAAAGAIGGLAGGGMVRGPGTETSDSILGIDHNSGMPTSWVSRNEFVVNARATAKQRAALEYINATGELPHFGWGGFLKAVSPFSGLAKRQAKMLTSYSPIASTFNGGDSTRGNKGFAWSSPAASIFSRASGGYIGNQPSPSFAPISPRSSFSAGDAGKVENHYHMPITINARDAADVKRSEGQIKRRMYDSLRQTSARLT